MHSQLVVGRSLISACLAVLTIFTLESMGPIGSTTAEKLEGSSRGVDADPLHFLPLFLFRLPPLLHPRFTPSLPYIFLPSNFPVRSGATTSSGVDRNVQVNKLWL